MNIKPQRNNFVDAGHATTSNWEIGTKLKLEGFTKSERTPRTILSFAETIHYIRFYWEAWKVSYRRSGKSRLWACGGRSCCKFKKRWIAQKLRIILLLHCGLATFKFYSGKVQQSVMFMVSAPNGCVHDTQNQSFSTLDTPNYSKYLKTNPGIFLRNIILGNRRIAHIHAFLQWWNRRVPANPWDPSYKFPGVLDMGFTSSRKHELKLC